MNTAIAGEVRFTVKNNGITKLDTGYQKNLILDNGLHTLMDSASSTVSTDIMSYCVLGVGNSAPAINQNALDVCIAGVTGSNDGDSYNYTNDGTGLYKTYRTKKFLFTNLAGNNISEIGLCSTYSNTATYNLCTRVLVKDEAGIPTTIALLQGDELTIHYRLYLVVSTADTTYKVNFSDGFGGTSIYTAVSRLYYAGSTSWSKLAGTSLTTGLTTTGYPKLYITDIGYITAGPSGSANYELDGYSPPQLRAYNNDFKRIMDVNFSANQGDATIKTLVLPSSFGCYQISFTNDTTGGGIPKDTTKTLKMPVEFTVSRFDLGA